MRRYTHHISRDSFDPRAAVTRLYGEYGTWRSVAQAIGCYSASYWAHVAKGLPPSARAERALRRHLGVPTRPRLADLPVTELRQLLRTRSEVG